MTRRNNAIATALAVNNPKEIDKVLPAPKPPAPPKEDFVDDRWWE